MTAIKLRKSNTDR